MTADPFAQLFRSSADLFVQSLDVAGDRLLVARMAEADYAGASFLDQRILTQDRPCQWFGWEDLERLSGSLPATARHIFHIGHVGSTLISRLLGELPDVLAVREPVLLRGLADLRRIRGRPESAWSPHRFDARVGMALGWLSRTFRPEQRAIVKDGKIEIATMMSVTLSCDHRAVDGALGAELIGAFKTLIENPVMMMV